jgi:prepilin-type N-terminal cleavage/methylation domain-containing protein
MKKTFSSKKSAFSLIELSIVLIIIGLLIAGITGGASLIKSSELRSVMGEARGYAVAVNAFYTQFNALPGDYATAVGSVSGVTTPASGLAVGDGDTKIEFCTTGCVTGATTATGSEGAIAWQHLKFAGAIDTAPTFAGGATVSQVVGTNFPSSKIRASGWGFDYRTRTDDGTNPANQNVVVLTGTTSTTAATVDTNTLVNGTPVSTGVILPTDALAIDSKIDDGIPTTGKIRGVQSACYSGTGTAGVYTVATASKVCALSYQVDVNS